MVKEKFSVNEAPSNEVLDRIKRIEERLNSLETIMKTTEALPSKPQPKSVDMSDLLSLPSSLQKTMLAIQELKEGTSNKIAEKTGRDRTVETIYLNQLARLGYLTRERRSRKVFFKILRYY